MVAFLDAFVYVREVGAEARDWLQDGGAGMSVNGRCTGDDKVLCLPVWAVKSFDGLSVEIFYCLLV